jgi:predicted DCC family thiol-disulfide oxidoreductase YuxK
VASTKAPVEKILFFDGVCNLCNFFIDFLIKRKQASALFFAPLQGPTAQKMLAPSFTQKVDSVIYLKNGQVWRESSAALMVLADLGGVWALARFFLVIPTVVRDGTYRWVARNRYKVFGKRDTCRLPSQEERRRFLD